MAQLNTGNVLDHRELETIHGKAVQIPDRERLVHLQFRRYSGCPVCNLHLHTMAQRHDEIVAAGIVETVVFHSSRETMLDLQGQIPFELIADPGQELYAAFGVEKRMSPLLALHPRSWKAAGRALTSAPSLRGATGKGEEHRKLPADFLIDTDGRLLAAHYGSFVDDHWSVDTLLELGSLAQI